MYNYHKASEDMYEPPKSTNTCYDVRLSIISYFTSKRFRPYLPPASIIYYAYTLHSSSRPRRNFSRLSTVLRSIISDAFILQIKGKSPCTTSTNATDTANHRCSKYVSSMSCRCFIRLLLRQI